MILYRFFHSSGRGGEDASTRGEKKVREVGKWGGWEANGRGKKKLFIKVFIKLTLESMPLFLACKNIFSLFKSVLLRSVNTKN